MTHMSVVFLIAGENRRGRTAWPTRNQGLCLFKWLQIGLQCRFSFVLRNRVLVNCFISEAMLMFSFCCLFLDVVHAVPESRKLKIIKSPQKVKTLTIANNKHRTH